MKSVVFTIALLAPVTASAEQINCRLTASCDGPTGCADESANIVISATDTTLTLEHGGPIALSRVSAGEVLDRVTLSDGEMVIQATEETLVFSAEGRVGAIIQGRGDEIILMMRELPGRDADNRTVPKTWRGMCGGFF